MRRDWEVIKAILKAAEELEDPQGYLKPEDFPAWAPELVAYQMKLLIQAGLVEGNCSKAMNRGPYCFVYGLTWEGHEFLDLVRERSFWNRIVKTARERGLELSFEAIKAMARFLIGA